MNVLNVLTLAADSNRGTALLVAIGVAVAVGVVAWLLIGGRDSGPDLGTTLRGYGVEGDDDVEREGGAMAELTELGVVQAGVAATSRLAERAGLLAQTETKLEQ